MTQARARGLKAHADYAMSNESGIKDSHRSRAEAVRPTAQTPTTQHCNG